MYNLSASPITGGYYSLIRVLLGCYLVIHFIHLLPYSAEIFSAQGLLPSELSPLLGIIPNPLDEFDSPVIVQILMIIGALGGVSIMLGYFDRVSSLVVVILLGWLFARNPLIANPSMPVVGWMLVAHAMLPSGAYGTYHAKGQPERWVKWHYPKEIWFAAWFMLAVAYTYSGYTKLLSPSWVDGTAINLVLNNPIARDHFLNDILLSLPPIFLKLITWSVLYIELFFVVFCYWGFTRKWAWFLMLMIQFGFLTFLNFADLTFPMLLIHALTFDKRWLDKYRTKNAILFYDGTCAFCNGIVSFCLSEDTGRRLKYSPLQGSTFSAQGLTQPKSDSIVILTDNGNVLYKSDAAVYCLRAIGGLWLVLGSLILVLPKVFRDKVYDAVGKVRYKLAGKISDEACQLLPNEYKVQLLP